MKINLQLTTLALGCVMSFNAQNSNPINNPGNVTEPVKKKCGTVMPSQAWDDAFNKAVEKYKEGQATGKAAMANYTIPVIFHVVHGGEGIGTYPNLSQAQVTTQITVLNNDFAGVGLNAGNLAATAFSAVGAANCNIYFCLATKNPTGGLLPEPGIDRINYVTKGWSNPASFGSTSSFQNFIDGTVKPNSIWDPSFFLNIWVTNENFFSIGLLGYATFPAFAGLAGLPSGGSATTDGVWLYAAATGTVGTLEPAFARGRTATHEVGHYLGLRHIGGDGNGNPAGDCAATDYCADTPPQKGGFGGGQYGQNYGTPSYPLHVNDCSPNDPNGDMFMNFMDYGDDVAIYMFTPNQRDRIQTAMLNGLYRSQLTASSGTQCNAGITPTAIVAMPANVCNTVGVVTASNSSAGNPVPTYSWSTSPSAGITYSPSSTDANPSITFPSAGVYSITCAATNTMGSSSAVSVVTVDVCDVGIAKNSAIAGHVALFPNPSNGKVSVIVTLPFSQSIEILVHNALGQVLNTSKHTNVTNNMFSIDMSAYSNGVYFVTVSNGQERVIKRLILNK